MVASADLATTGRIWLLGIPVDRVDRDAARAWIHAALLADDGRCRHVVTLNPEYAIAARRDPGFGAAVRSGDLIVADGVGIVLAARLHARTERAGLGRVTGVELVEWLTADSGPLDAPLFLLGAKPGVGAAAAARLQALRPHARIAGWWGDGSPSPIHDAATLERIRESGARTVVVAYGAQGQIAWIVRNRDALAAAGVRLAIGVGGALDYHAGVADLPPAIVRRAGFEWLWRLLREPWRWKRQLALPLFAALALREAGKRRAGR